MAREPLLEPLDIMSLRPTQMTVGLREVKDKRKRWREVSKRKQALSLGRHMIPVVRGPDKRHYVVDHHHLARALHDEGVKDVFVTIIADLTMVDRDAFWGVLDNHRWVYPYDAKERAERFAICRKRLQTCPTTHFAALQARSAAPAGLPRTPRHSANFSGPIICAAGYRANRSKRISTGRWQRPANSPRAAKRSTCRDGPVRFPMAEDIISAAVPSCKTHRSAASR